MAYLIILIVLALALAPIMALKPSKTQKLQAQLRDRARQLGLQVQIGHLPQTHRQKVRQEDPESGVAYRLLWRHPDAKYMSFEYLVHRQETERYSMPPLILDLLQQHLQQLPDTILAIEFTQQTLGIYWQERGDEETVTQIANQLDSLKAALQDQPLQSIVKQS